jgi:hypothetical protein
MWKTKGCNVALVLSFIGLVHSGYYEGVKRTENYPERGKHRRREAVTVDLYDSIHERLMRRKYMINTDWICGLVCNDGFPYGY